MIVDGYNKREGLHGVVQQIVKYECFSLKSVLIKRTVPLILHSINGVLLNDLKV